MQALRRRARPLSWAVAAAFFFGFITEVYAAAAFVYQLGPMALVIIYITGGLSLLAVALLQMTWIDRLPRNKAFVRVTIAYGVAFLVALGLIMVKGGPQMTTYSGGEQVSTAAVWGTGLVWLVADQLNFLLPLIIWAIVGDLFNAGEGRRVFPWVTSWQYGGQLLGLAVGALSPLLLVPLGLPLWTVLIICPIGIFVMGYLLPRALKGRSFSRGHGRSESLSVSLKSTWDFVGGVSAFKALFVATVLVFVAAQTLEASFLSSAERVLQNQANLQVLYGLTLVAVFAACGILQKWYTTRILERLNISGTLALLPPAAVAAAVLLIIGILLGSNGFALALMVLGILCWWIPRWSVGDVARHTAMAVVPDEKRARVSFVTGVVPFAAGLFVAGLVTWVVYLIGFPVIAPVVALVFAILAAIPARKMVALWADAMLDPRLRRRKRLSD
jgi:hypothetical protein